MRHTILILAFFICCFEQTEANKIDSLKTDKDVEKFISALFKQKYDSDHYTFHFAKPDSINNHFFFCDSAIKLEPGKWQKTDFNNDGLTDLFTIIYRLDTLNPNYHKHPEYEVYVVIDQKDNKYQLNEIHSYFKSGCFSAKPIIVNDYPCILYHYINTVHIFDTLSGMDTVFGFIIPHTKSHDIFIGMTDTLIYKFGGFVELSSKNNNIPPIESIYYETTGCLGSCPTFKLNIFKDGTAYYLNETIDESNGNFRGTINQNKLDEIIGLINFINAPNLENNYSASYTDMQSCKLIIYFSDGSVKEIYDDGLQGTLGLVRLYDLLFALRLNQQWK